MTAFIQGLIYLWLMIIFLGIVIHVFFGFCKACYWFLSSIAMGTNNLLDKLEAWLDSRWPPAEPKVHK